ncbi:Uncharacterized membrane protein YcaP, DUF421 family [Alkalithermobacter thermoalcaliphilus JW-YL-7 = DSM 7308]|uniref:Uncharacterized membrane protein YcaP, DUF421 family n=1 Tax=Alkalithermobacter thermoalcaliphilus JW-YL-7 = DSM 7308 TaxID=1121328 RepID=A0A150FP22_CLOPD|nr:protein of unknown function DUF421 [[Clostridium] paradoxum JW-YL-7 = DSM 7308]SHK53176.1 Uncharacterized membrane protein YcaP, DUF421 family [[Clostridium] paradoxum JW-YL-7 = DSM 7308]
MDISSFLHLTVELTIGFFALLIITKIIGQRQLNQITPFDFISALVLGELLGNAIYDPEVNILFILYALSLWGFLIYVIEKITQKFMKTRSFFEGNPALVIKNGQIDFNELKKQKIDINELQSLLRTKDVFSIREVEYAILEPSGSISVLRKSKYENPKSEDLNIPQKQVYLPVCFILDGKLLIDNLKSCGFDENWLQKQLKSNNINNIEDVLIAEWKKDEGLFIQKKTLSVN